jgi:hypothetical protein
MDEIDSRHRSHLPAILIAAVLQGWALYGLHKAIEHGAWPATDRAWLYALYALWIYIPATVQLLAMHVRQRALWLALGVLALAFFGMGWHYGASIAPARGELGWNDPPFGVAFPMTVLWLMLLPFLQGRLANDRWRSSYGDYFSAAWHNKLRLAEAAAFTGVFWLLLALWAGLFKLLQIEFFRELFERPLFIYPVTALTFGIALHLIGTQQRLVTVVLQQLLGLLKWLALVAGLLLLLFTLALLPQLPQLFGAGHRVIDAHWLLGLVAVMVLLLNAAYRDGSVAQPYPRPIALALRVVAPLLVIIAVTALYALGLRIGEFGLTVARTWGLVVAFAALAYAAGYSWAALRPGHWMAAMGRVNVAVALALIALIFLLLTPVLSPWRLAAASQYRVALAGTDDRRVDAALSYLRWDARSYGHRRLEQLASLADHPRAAALREAVARVRAMPNRRTPLPVDNTEAIATLPVFPAGRELDAALRKVLTAPETGVPGGMSGRCMAVGGCAGLYVDLDGDTREEFVLLLPNVAWVYRLGAAGWQQVGNAQIPGGTPREELIEALRAGDFGTQARLWRDLRIGTRVLGWLMLPANPPGSRPRP